MQVTWSHRGARLTYRFEPESGDRGVDRHGAALVRTRCTLDLPPGWDPGTTHPDLIAAAGLIMVHPWIGHRIRFARPISTDLAAATGFDAGPTDPVLVPRALPREGSVALAYSGGVDSTAALLLLPPGTRAVYLRREIPADLGAGELVGRALGLRRRRHRTAGAEAAVAALAAAGRPTTTVPTDLEFLRRRVGFPVDIATAVPVLITADHHGTDAVAFGTIMESAYRIGHRRFTDYAATDHYRYWGRIFRTLGLPFHQITAGLSEVATSRLVGRSPFAPIAQSCVRGGPGDPCRNCVKCFRKALVSAAVDGVDLDDLDLDHLFSIEDVRRALTKTPIHHENVYTYATRRYRGDHDLMTLLRRRVRGDRLAVQWMRRWYPPAAGLLPPHRRDEAVAALTAALRAMTTDDIGHAEGWDVETVLDTAEYRRRAADLADALGRDRARER